MSNRRRTIRLCDEADCYREAEVEMVMWNDGDSNQVSRPLCRHHAMELTRRWPGKVWGDSKCKCGLVHDVIDDAGRTPDGELRWVLELS
jgi:hypothetical protein